MEENFDQENGAQEPVAGTATEGKQIIDPSDPLEMNFLVELPEHVEITSIPRVTEIKQIWQSGIRRVEEAFQDTIQKMNIEFDVKTSDYSRIRDQLVTNHDFLQRWYLDMQAKLNAKWKAIQAERAQWEHDKTEIAGMTGNLDSEVVALNVGGTAHLMTERDVLRLCPESTLAKMFSGLHELKKIDNEVFLDRDGQTF